MSKIVKVSRDTLGWLLVYARDWNGNRTGEPLGAPDYYKSRADARFAAKQINEMSSPGLVLVHVETNTRH